MRKSSVVLIWVILLCIVVISGCEVMDVKELLTPSGPLSYSQLFNSYNDIELDKTNAAEAIEAIYLPEFELLSQSTSVIASVGEKKKGYKSWFKLVAFDEDSYTAKRKYFFVVDEKPKQLFVTPRTYVRYYCQMKLDDSVNDEPYADNNARLIGILKWAITQTRADIDEVAADNKVLAADGMMINQALETVITKLNASPAHAEKIEEEDGLAFGHISLDKGKIKMVVEDDKVSIQMALGSYVKKFKISFEKFEDVDEAPAEE